MQEKFYKCLFEIKLISKLPFLEILYEKYKLSCTYIFEQLLKKIAEFLDSSARLETSSMTISLSRVAFSPKILFTLFLFCVSYDLDIFLNSSSKSFKHFDLVGNET